MIAIPLGWIQWFLRSTTVVTKQQFTAFEQRLMRSGVSVISQMDTVSHMQAQAKRFSSPPWLISVLQTLNAPSPIGDTLAIGSFVGSLFSVCALFSFAYRILFSDLQAVYPGFCLFSIISGVVLAVFTIGDIAGKRFGHVATWRSLSLAKYQQEGHVLPPHVADLVAKSLAAVPNGRIVIELLERHQVVVDPVARIYHPDGVAMIAIWD